MTFFMARRPFPVNEEFAWFTFGVSAFNRRRFFSSIAIASEWKLFHHPDFERVCGFLKEPVVFDGRNIYNPDMMKRLGVTYYGMGRGASIERGASAPLR